MKMAKIDKKTLNLLEESKGYIVLTENGMSVDMQTSKVLASVTTLLMELKEEGSIDDEDIDKLCELAKISRDEKGISQILKKLANLLEELED